MFYSFKMVCNRFICLTCLLVVSFNVFSQNVQPSSLEPREQLNQIWLPERFVNNMEKNGVYDRYDFFPIQYFEKINGEMYVKAFEDKTYVATREKGKSTKDGVKMDNPFVRLVFLPRTIVDFYAQSTFYYIYDDNDILLRIVTPKGVEIHRFVPVEGYSAKDVLDKYGADALTREFLGKFLNKE